MYYYITEVSTCELVLVYFNPFFSGTKAENIYSPVCHTVTAITICIISIKPSFFGFLLHTVALGVISEHLIGFTVPNETVNGYAGFYLSTIYCVSSQKQYY